MEQIHQLQGTTGEIITIDVKWVGPKINFSPFLLHRQAIEATTMKILLTDIWPFSKYIRVLPRQPGPGMSARNQPPVLKQCMMGKLLLMWRQLYPLLCSLLSEYDWSAERWCHDHVMLWLVRVIKIQNDLDWAINFRWPSLCYRQVESSQPSC